MLFGGNLQRLVGTKMGIKTQFFHASATARKKRNRILSLDDDTGNKITNEQGLRDVTQHYFVNIFQK